MKKYLKNCLIKASQNRFLWPILSKTIVPLGYFINVKHHLPEQDTKERAEQIDIERLINIISPERKVRHGPFKGMFYPEAKSIGSALLSKLMGCYENELHETIEYLCNQEYDTVVDIGCAEGYYAVGFALRIPSAKVYAYDTNTIALKLCSTMAKANNANKNITLGTLCDQDELIKITKKSQRALIISDCEGYEKELFSDNEILKSNLANHDLLIEVHDFKDIEISTTLREFLSTTHSLISIFSLDDISKVREYSFPETTNLNIHERFRLFAERRPGRMEWYYCKSNLNG